MKVILSDKFTVALGQNKVCIQLLIVCIYPCAAAALMLIWRDLIQTGAVLKEVPKCWKDCHLDLCVKATPELIQT